jgi:hypothetical protein
VCRTNLLRPGKREEKERIEKVKNGKEKKEKVKQKKFSNTPPYLPSPANPREQNLHYPHCHNTFPVAPGFQASITTTTAITTPTAP